MDVIKAPADDRPASPTTAGRWIGVGASTDPDSRQAGLEAATTALRGADPRLLVIFASPAHDLPAMLAGIRSVAPEIPLVGCSTSGEIATDGPSDASVVVTAIGGSGFSVSTSVARNASSDLRQAGATAAACTESAGSGEHQVLLLLTDGLGGDQQEVVRGAYSVVGRIGPARRWLRRRRHGHEKTFQFFDGEVLEDSVVGAAINSDAPLGIGVQHGWTRVGAPFLVTASSGTRVVALDDRPALDVYLERLNAPEDAAHRRRRVHALRVDASVRAEPAERRGGALHRRGELRGSLHRLHRRSPAGRSCLDHGGRRGLGSRRHRCRMHAGCRRALGGQPLGFLAFDCIARRGVLGDDGIRQEVERITSFSRGAPVAGFYTYGEIARTHGVNGFHNQTLVVLAFG